ncbi:hypothetical protein PT974_03973 [Cladobotryum mycophilum]|uniref:F-box domain-containing protein n=1 Tax=Cladobotryum mycophilum TaxID=491253 RepID=A0ABR0STT1_9HYPO
MAPTPVLPNEILQLLFRHFCSHCRNEHISILQSSTQQIHQGKPLEKASRESDHHTLWSLCLVSKQFRDLAQPLLYHQFIVGYGIEGRMYDSERQRLLAFTQTVMRRRDLARKIDRVFIHRGLVDSLCDVERLLATLRRAAVVSNPCLFSSPEMISSKWARERDYAMFKRTFTPVPDGQPFWAAGTIEHEQYLAMEVVAALVALLPKLAHLVIQNRSSWPNVKGSYPISPQVFDIRNPSVKTLETGLPMKNMMGIIDAAVNLETLHLDAIDETYDFEFEQTIGKECPAMPKLRHIRFTRSKIQLHYMRTIVGKCTGSLETFFYEVWREPRRFESCIQEIFIARSSRTHYESNISERTVPPTTPVRLSHVFQILSAHKGTLKRLHLDYRGASQRHTCELPTWSLRDFSALTNIFYGAYEIYPILDALRKNQPQNSALPISLKSLALAGVGAYIPAIDYSVFPADRQTEPEGAPERFALFSLAEARANWPAQFANLEQVDYSFEKELLGAHDLADLTRVFTSSGVRFSHKHIDSPTT